MQSITKEYLLDIIRRKISATIHLHRKRHPYSFTVVGSSASSEEVKEFILTIPYFDASLKNFLTSLADAQTIISQAWELEFIKKCELWMQGYEWLYGTPCFSNEQHVYQGQRPSLALPY